MKIIKKGKGNVLVEYETLRYWVSTKDYNSYLNANITEDELVESSISGSVFWSDYIDLGDVEKRIEEELHKRGFHQPEDLLKNTGAVSAALLAAIALPSNKLYNIVRKEQIKQLRGEL